jgi:hypothetical protein
MQLTQDSEEDVECVEYVTWEGWLFVAHSECTCPSEGS